MVNRFEMWNGQKLLLFIFNSNQKEQLFVWPTKYFHFIYKFSSFNYSGISIDEWYVPSFQ